MNNGNDFNSNGMNNNQGNSFYNNFSQNQNGNMNNGNMNNNYNNGNNGGYTNSHYEYQEKQYNSGFLDSHTEVTGKSQISRFFLFGFYFLFIVIAIVLLIIFLKGRGKDGISFKNSSVRMEVGGTEVLEVVDNDGKEVTDKLTWTSNDDDIVTVDENGIVRANSEGKAVVTVKNEKGNAANCNITVYGSSETPTDEPVPTDNADPTATPKVTATPKPSSSTKTPTPKPTAVAKTRCCCMTKELTRCSWRANVKSCPSVQAFEDSSQSKCNAATKPTPTTAPSKTPTPTPTPKPGTEPSIPASTFNSKYVQFSTKKIEMNKGETKTFTIKVYNAVAIFDIKATKANDNTVHVSVDPTTTTQLDGLSSTGTAQWVEAKIKVTGKSSGYSYVVITPNSAGVITYDTVDYLKGSHTILVHVK